MLVQGIENDVQRARLLPLCLLRRQQRQDEGARRRLGQGPGLREARRSRTCWRGTYNPLSRPLFIYVSKKSADKPEVKQFVEFVMTKAPALIKEVKYVPLPEEAYKMGSSASAKDETGIGLRRRAGGRASSRRDPQDEAEA